MSKLRVKMVTKNYDHLSPLACGDVVAEGIDLELDRRTPKEQFYDDPSYHAGEISFGQYLIRTSQGERAYIGMPVFVTGVLRHRCFFVLRGSDIREFKDLEGKRVGTNAWPDTGNTWSRATLRENGVDIGRIEWRVGPLDDPSYDSFGHRPKLKWPSNVRPVAAGQTIRDILLAGELDALMCSHPPKGFYEADSRIVRLYPNYREMEQAHGRRMGYVPGSHIIAVRREVTERAPWVVGSLYRALDQSKREWQANRRRLTDTSPWLLSDLEETAELFGDDWRPYGVGPNRRMIERLCEEELAQELVDRPIDPDSVFAEFERLLEG